MLEDILGPASALLPMLKAVFHVCFEKHLKLNLRKCESVATNVQFYGRPVDSKGFQFYPSQYKALALMKLQLLFVIVRGVNCMRMSIPKF